MKPLRVLVVDDDRMVLQCVEVTLKPKGHDVQACENGKQAIQIATMFDPELILTDILMPEKDGYELITELRRLRFPARIIAMSSGGKSGFMTSQIADILRVFKVTTFLNKPFRPEQLLAAIDTEFAK